jgi:hypothetical protein
MGILTVDREGPATKRRRWAVWSGRRSGQRRGYRPWLVVWAAASTMAAALVALSSWGPAGVDATASARGQRNLSEPASEFMAVLSRAVVFPGSDVVVRAGGFAPGSGIEVGLKRQTASGGAGILGTGRASAQGHLSATLKVPEHMNPGAYVVYLFGHAPGGAKVSDQVAVMVG